MSTKSAMRSRSLGRAMLPLAAVVGIFAVFSGSANAAEILYEPFDYTPDSGVGGAAGDAPVEGLVSGATGLTGNFTSTASATNAYVQVNSLSYGALSTAGHKVRFALNSAPDLLVSLDTAVFSGKLDDGDVLWFSMLVNMPGAAPSNTFDFGIGIDADNLIGFKVDKIDNPTVQLRAREVTGGTETLGTGSSTWLWETEGGLRLVAGKITFGPSTDTIDIYEVGMDLVLPDDPVSSVTATLDNASFDQIIIEITNGNSAHVDEIRFGESFSDVGLLLPPPVITASSPFAIANESFSLSITGGGTDYQWTFEGGDLSGETTSVLTFDPIQEINTGNYEASFEDGARKTVVSASYFVSVLPSGTTLPLVGLLGLGLLTGACAIGGASALRRKQ